MKFFQKIAIASILFVTTQSIAFTPESGLWWNPDEPGTGVSIEIQDNFMFIAIYVYDEAGNPIWYTSGQFLQGNSLFDGELDYHYNGTCIDCSYTPHVTIKGERGPVTINFLTETTATIQFQGAVKSIERFNFFLGDKIEQMLGEWQTIIDFSSNDIDFPFSGDVLLFDITSFSDGDKFAEGCRPDNTIDGFCSDFALDNHDMAAIYDDQEEQLLVVVNDSEDFWLAYYLDLGLDQFDGVAELYSKDFGHNNVFYPVRGFRTASRSFVETGVGPSKALSNKNKTVTGIGSKEGTISKAKSLSDFSKKEQNKIQRQQLLIQKLINSFDTL